jgi:hypothetical protein
MGIPLKFHWDSTLIPLEFHPDSIGIPLGIRWNPQEFPWNLGEGKVLLASSVMRFWTYICLVLEDSCGRT